METARTRRAFVATVSSAFLAGLAGCPSPPGASGTPSPTQGERLCTEAVTPGRRSGTDGDHPIVREYPDLPDEISRESAVDYATSFEEAHQLNRLARQSSTREYEVKQVFNVRSNEEEGGFVVSFVMDLSWKEDSGGMTVIADYTPTVTYFISNRTVIRHEGDRDADPREEDVGEIVVCRGPA